MGWIGFTLMLPKASVNLEEPPTCDGGDTQKSARDATFMDTTVATSKVAMNMHIYIYTYVYTRCNANDQAAHKNLSFQIQTS